MVKDMKYVNLREPFPRIVYFAAAQADTGVSCHSYVVRAAAAIRGGWGPQSSISTVPL